METRKEKIIKQLKDRFGDLSCISIEKVADAIMALPIDVLSDVDIEDMADKKHPCYNDHVDSNAIDCNIGFIEGAKWMRDEILKRNGKDK